MGRQEDTFGVGRAFTDTLQHLQTIHGVQPQIDQGDLDVLFRDDFQGLLAGWYRYWMETFVADDHFERLAKMQVVIDDQNAG
jgi:hypothetical protein